MAAGGGVRKLVVKVVQARDLLPKDGAGSSSPYAIIDFNGQRKRTQVMHRNLNPAWDEVHEFDVGGEQAVKGELLEVDLLHDRKAGPPSRRSNFLGRLRLDSSQFVREGEEALVYYPLQKKSFFSWVRGDIGLMIYFSKEPLTPPPDIEKPEERPGAEAQETAAVEASPDSHQPAPEPPSEGAETPAADKQVSTPENPPADKQVPTPENPPAHDSTPTAAHTEEPPVTAEPDTTSDPSLSRDAKNNAADVLQPQKTKTVTSQPTPVWAETAEEIQSTSSDLVDKMQYLFVRVVRAQSLPGRAANPRVRIVVSGRTVCTGPAAVRGIGHSPDSFDWDQTFTFPLGTGSIHEVVASDQAPLEISVWDLPLGSPDNSGTGEGRFLGGVCFDVLEVPTRDPPDSPLAPQWYRLESDDGFGGGDLMLATWLGTQVDESFHGAWKADAPCGGGSARSKTYLSPKLWYLRLSILDCQELLPLPAQITSATTPSINTPMSVKATLGFQSLRTRLASLHRGGSPAPPKWNEDLLFVVAEPLGDQVVNLTLELRPWKEPPAVVAVASIPLSSVERRVDDRKVASRWLELAAPPAGKKAAATGPRLRGRLQVQVCLDGGYHVTDEPTGAYSDYRPSARQLWRPPVGTVELGIIGCRNLVPVNTEPNGEICATADAYAVAKYGPKWARTRTMANSLDPTWNEQYKWPVYDPCTALTIGIFSESPVNSANAAADDDNAGEGTLVACCPIGRVRIRISALDSGRAYRASYPLYVLLPTGLRHTGHVDIAVRFTRAGSSLDLLPVYGRPLLPTMHFVRSIPASRQQTLRLAAARTVAAHLARSEPSLRREVVMYLLEADDSAQTRFSMRKVRANWNRVMSSLMWIASVAQWVDDVRWWRNPTATVLTHMVVLLLLWHPDLIVAALGFHFSLAALWRYKRRPRGTVATGHVDLRASQLEAPQAEELDEEFDTMPSGVGAMEVVRARYDRLRVAGERVQNTLADLAGHGERLRGMATWQDPRATWIFVAACLCMSALLLVVPVKAAVAAAAIYWLRHPVFRDRAPPRVLNFFRRLPTLSDRIM